MLERIEGMPENVVAVDARGTVSGEDYRTLLIPLIDNTLRKYGKISVLNVMGRGFAGFTAEALWDDVKIRLKHFRSFRKVAVVSDVNWVVAAVRIFSVLIPCPVRVFHNEKLQEAKAWVSE